MTTPAAPPPAPAEDPTLAGAVARLLADLDGCTDADRLAAAVRVLAHGLPEVAFDPSCGRLVVATARDALAGDWP